MLDIEFQHYIISGVGAITLYFKLKSSGKDVIQFLPHFKSSWAEAPFARLIDALLFTLIGALIGTILTQPETPQQALAAGLGWTGLINSFAKE